MSQANERLKTLTSFILGISEIYLAPPTGGWGNDKTTCSIP